MTKSLLCLLVGTCALSQAEPIALSIDSGVDIRESGDYVVRGRATGVRGGLSVNAPGKSVNLTLDNIEIIDSANDNNPVTVSLIGNIHLFLKGKNTILSGGGDGVYKYGCAMKFSGDTGDSFRIDEAPRAQGDPDAPGSLWLSGSDRFILGVPGLCGGPLDPVVIGSGEVHAQGGSRSPGMRSVRIEGGIVEARGGDWGSGIEGDFAITGGQVTAVGGSWGAGIANSKVVGVATYEQYHTRIEGGIVTAVPGNEGGEQDGIGKQNSGYPKLDPCGYTTITGGIVRTGWPGSEYGGRICGDSLRITGGSIAIDWIDANHLDIQGGTFPGIWMEIIKSARAFVPRWNGRDTTYFLLLRGLPKNTVVDSLHLDSDPRYGTKDMRTDSLGRLGITVPPGRLSGWLALDGKVLPFGTDIKTLDNNTLSFESILAVAPAARASLPAVRIQGRRILLDGLTVGMPISVTDPAGRIQTRTTATGPRTSLELDRPGVYQVRCGSTTRRVLALAP